MLLFDGSSHVNPGDFDLLADWLKRLVEAFDVAEYRYIDSYLKELGLQIFSGSKCRIVVCSKMLKFV